MKGRAGFIRDAALVLVVLAAAFGLSFLLLERFNAPAMSPMLFVLGVFLVSLRTQGYLWSVATSLISVLAVNYAFTYPYWTFDLISPECISTAVVMLVVSILTGALTTKLKQQEKIKVEAETERMRSNLLRAVSHDLRTPLTSIYGACWTMLENFDRLPVQTHKKMLRGICDDAQWLVRMVENLLSVTRVDAGQVQLSMQDTVLEELIDAALVKFHSSYPQQVVQVSLPEEFVSIPMDAMLIQQVLVNLLENAVRHAGDMRNLWLKVQLKGQWAVFSVEDDGRGIPPERMQGLFTGLLSSTDPAGSAPTDAGRGSMGIGLSVCSAIIRAHGGQICADRRPGGGASFRFTLERKRQAQGK